MSVLDFFRKGFGYVLLSMGVSRPPEKQKSPGQESPQPHPDKPEAPPPQS
jgi:hypothetical protein